MVQTYNEFKVILDNKGNIIKKNATERKTVRISEYTANVNNQYVDSTKLLYELAGEKSNETDVKKIEKEHRKSLFEKAKELGLDVPKNIKTDLLINKIKEAKE